MLLSFIFLTIACISRALDMPANVAEFAAPIHAACLQMSPQSMYTLAYQSMVCGASFSPSPEKSAWAQTGLLHLLVVSGSHLLFLEAATSLPEKWLKNSKLKVLTFAVLVAFCTANLFQPPVARALIAFSLRRSSEFFHLNWARLRILTLSGLAAFGLCADRHAIISLLLSWIASLAVSAFRSRDPESAWQHQAKTYLLIAPALLPLAVPHPLSIACNVVMGPFLGAVLFPASLVCFFFPRLHIIVDFAWEWTMKLVKVVGSVMPTSANPTPIALWILVVYLGALSAVAFARERRS